MLWSANSLLSVFSLLTIKGRKKNKKHLTRAFSKTTVCHSSVTFADNINAYVVGLFVMLGNQKLI